MQACSYIFQTIESESAKIRPAGPVPTSLLYMRDSDVTVFYVLL